MKVSSESHLIAGTNRDLLLDVPAGRFRGDLLARINLWTSRLPGLAARRDDIESNLGYKPNQCARVYVGENAHRRFLDFATGPDAHW